VILLCLLVTVVAFTREDANKEKPQFANDRILIKLNARAMINTLPDELGVVSRFSGIPSLDTLMKLNSITGISLAHRKVDDKEWENRIGFNRWFILYFEERSSIDELVKIFNEDDNIEEAAKEELSYLMIAPNDANYASQWGHNNTAQLPGGASHTGSGVGTIGFDANAEDAWNQPQGWGNSSIIVAIIDTGVDTAHEDLTLVNGYDYGDNDNNPMDDSADEGHGTACAGVSTADTNNNFGIAGVAGNCRVMPLKVAESNGDLSGSAIRNAVTYAADNGADIASMSYGSSAYYGYNSTTDAVYQYAFDNGVALFAASGNDDSSTIGYPANHPSVIAVGAASPCGERKSASSCDGENWWGSDYGVNTQDAMNAIDICAPTILPATDITGSAGYSSGQYSSYFNGTSCATPYAAGVGALLLSLDPTLTPTQLRQTLRNTATDMTADGGAGWDRYTGYGLVNAHAALLTVTPGMPTCVITSPADNSTHDLGGTINVHVTATDTDGTISHVKFYLNGSTTPSYTDTSSPYSWSWNTSTLSGGDYAIEAIATDNSANANSNSINVTLAAPADEGFETGNFSAYPWILTGDGSWTVQSTDEYSGTYAAKSGNITHNQTTSLSITLNVTSSGNISFYQKASSEPSYDYLRFYIDSVEQDEWSGNGSWTLETYAVSTGSHTFKWEYEKDGSESDYDDCGYIDHIVFPPITISTPPQITYSPSSFSKNLSAGSTSSDPLSLGNNGDQTLSYNCSVQLPVSRTIIFEEGFESGNLPTGWSNEYVTDTQSWDYTAGGHNSHPSGAYEGSYNALLYNGSSTANVTRLVMPVQDLSGVSQANLFFWHTQELWPNDQDELRIFYKNTASGSWIQIAGYTNSIAAWSQENIALPNLSSTYYIAFEGTAQYGYGVCLDLVQIDGSGSTTPPWLTVNGSSSVSGSISDGDQDDILTIGYDATQLTAGVYNGNLQINSNDPSNSTINIPVSLTVSTGTPSTLIYNWPLDTDPGWSTEGLWEYGPPGGTGGQYGNPDPTQAYTGTNVLGYNNSGDYESSLAEQALTTTAIDCSGLTNTSVKFYRWLNVEAPTYDHAYVRVSNDLSNWTTIWENTEQTTDDSWQQFEYDISSVADGQANVYLRWIMGTTDTSWQFSGWNLDDIEIWGIGSGVNPLDPPQNLSIAVYNGQIAIQFSEVPSAVSYKVYGASHPSGTFTLLSSNQNEFIFNSGNGIWFFPATGHNYRYLRVTASSEPW